MAAKQDRYRLIILDDEYPALRGLQTLVDWDRFDIDVAATASDGAEGIKLVRKHRPDLVMTDIRMPGMDGLEFVKQASAMVPSCVFVVFSGYSDFTYAKDALSLGVIEYIEKPVTVEKVEALIPKALKRIEYRREHEALRSIRFRAQEGIVDNAILYMLEEEEFDVQGMEKVLEEIDGRLLRYAHVSVCMIAIDCPDDAVDAVHQRVAESLKALPVSECSAIPLVHRGGCIVLVFSARDDSHEILINKIQELDDPESTYRIQAGMSAVGDKLGDLEWLLPEAETALAAASSGDGSSIVRIQDVPRRKETPYLTDVDKDEILLHFRSRERRSFLQSLQRYLSQLRSIAVPGSVICRESQELFYLCVRIAQEMGNSRIITELDEVAFPEHALKWVFSPVFLRSVTGAFGRLFDAAYRQSNVYVHQSILRIREYIDKNYHHRDISLQMLSEISHLSPTYISKLFKKEVGMKYLDYLTTVRLEHSKILLAQGNRVNEVSDRVGYGNYRTFCLLFKKAYGMTPSAFTRVAKLKPS